MSGMLYMGTRMGRGQFGEVYEAEMQTASGLVRPVAVKVLGRDTPDREHAMSRFMDEATILGRLGHPGAAAIYDVCELEGRPAWIGELVEGPDLRKLCDGPTMPMRPLIEAFASYAVTLAACHQATDRFGAPLRLVHRDIKPANLLVDRRGVGKVIDFGVACFHSAERMAKSSDRMLVGSLAYMAPERFARSPGGHWRWDIYALGASMYRCLAGRSLMANRGIGEVMGLAASSIMWNKHVVKAMRRVRDDTPPDLWPLMLQCLRHEGHARPTGGELGERLEECARGLEGPGLRAWAAGLNWRHRHEDGALTGKSLAIEPMQMGVPEGFGPEV